MADCKICKKNWHWCSSCDVYGVEEAAWENGLCDSCFESIGGPELYSKREAAKEALDDACAEAIKKALEEKHRSQEKEKS